MMTSPHAARGTGCSDMYRVSHSPSVTWEDSVLTMPENRSRWGGSDCGAHSPPGPGLGGLGLRGSFWIQPDTLPLTRDTPHVVPIPYCDMDKISQRERMIVGLSVQDIKGLFTRVKDRFPHTVGLSRPSSKPKDGRRAPDAVRSRLATCAEAAESPSRTASAPPNLCPLGCGRSAAARSKHCCLSCVRSGGHHHGSSCSKREANASQTHQANSQPSLPSVSVSGVATDGLGRRRGGAVDRTFVRSIPSSSPALLCPPPPEAGRAILVSEGGSDSDEDAVLARLPSPSPPRSADRRHLTSLEPGTPPSHTAFPLITGSVPRRRKEGLDRLHAGEHSSGDLPDVLRNRASLQHEWLVHDPEFMRQQIGELKRGKAALRQALNACEEDDLYENACLFTPYAMTLRKRKGRINGQVFGGGGGLDASRGGLAPAPAEEQPHRKRETSSRTDAVTLQVRALKQNLKVSQKALEKASFEAFAAAA